jgi:hypothetical protein
MIMMCARVQANLITKNPKKNKVTARTPIYSKKLKSSFPNLTKLKKIACSRGYS